MTFKCHCCTSAYQNQSYWQLLLIPNAMQRNRSNLSWGNPDLLAASESQLLCLLRSNTNQQRTDSDFKWFQHQWHLSRTIHAISCNTTQSRAIWQFDRTNKLSKKEPSLSQIKIGHSSSIWFCPLFCPLPHLPYILPSFFALALALFFVEGKGKGKKWGQNIGQIWKRAKRRAKIRGQKFEFIWNNLWVPRTST